ncbi:MULTISPECIES: hypothetical protein [Morganella]|uniref:hypothetical protein n=1 Tax=Morganella TaxID=581 RepID=UPI0023678E26|nr:MULTISPECIES: hypothetical protein [Morganella]MDH0357110.1 hypothetical protein [Morganella sp. GD04133]
MKLVNRMCPVLLAGSFLLFSLPSHAADLPIKVDAKADKKHFGGITHPLWRYTITSMDNNITLQSLELNRGNCKISTNDRGKNTNVRLGFGQSYTFTSPTNSSYTDCRPLELIVNTDKGSYTFTW